LTARHDVVEVEFGPAGGDGYDVIELAPARAVSLADAHRSIGPGR
jgi:hypothetical protein